MSSLHTILCSLLFFQPKHIQYLFSQDGSDDRKKTAALPELSPNAVTVLERRYLKRDKDGKILEARPTCSGASPRPVADAEKPLPRGKNRRHSPGSSTG